MNELARITPLTPDRMRADAVRRRCRAELRRRATRAHRADAIASAWPRVIVPVLLGTMSVAYAVALVSATLQIEHWLR